MASSRGCISRAPPFSAPVSSIGLENTGPDILASSLRVGPAGRFPSCSTAFKYAASAASVPMSPRASHALHLACPTWSNNDGCDVWQRPRVACL
ncbi:MAG: hypothetical protein Q8P67_01700 [archaeon]|nr:hypothetical protein [archaeon]